MSEEQSVETHDQRILRDIINARNPIEEIGYRYSNQRLKRILKEAQRQYIMEAKEVLNHWSEKGINICCLSFRSKYGLVPRKMIDRNQTLLSLERAIISIRVKLGFPYNLLN